MNLYKVMMIGEKNNCTVRVVCHILPEKKIKICKRSKYRYMSEIKVWVIFIVVRMLKVDANTNHILIKHDNKVIFL